jgi:uncharacterized protein (UPF0335 family)
MNNKDLSERLLDIGERIDEVKTEKAELDGRKKSVIDTLKKRFNCNDVEAARTLLSKKKKDEVKKVDALKKGVEELEAEIE